MQQPAQPNLLTRDDTFFGICEGLGRDIGIHPNFLRLALAVGTFFSPLGALAAYAAAGLIVVATRLLFPEPRLSAPAAEAPAAEPEAAPAAREEEFAQAA